MPVESDPSTLTNFLSSKPGHHHHVTQVKTLHQQFISFFKLCDEQSCF